LDVYFTIENAGEKGRNIFTISEFLMPKAVSNDISKEDIIKMLNQWLPDADIQVSQTNLKVIRIIDKRLLEMKGYALNESISDVNFSGSPFLLLKYIAKQIHTLSTSIWSADSLRPSFDVTTNLKIKADKLTVRDALTKGLSINKCNNFARKSV
jgi:hypothetical protein